MSGSAFLNNDAMRVVERNDRGVVTYRKRYKRGDKIDTSHMSDDRVQALLDNGTFVSSKDDVRSTGRAAGAYPGAKVTGAATGEAGDQSQITGPGAGTPVEGLDDGDADTEGEDDVEDVDTYSSMDYADLQNAAKAASPPIQANQSADDLRAALRAQA